MRLVEVSGAFSVRLPLEGEVSIPFSAASTSADISKGIVTLHVREISPDSTSIQNLSSDEARLLVSGASKLDTAFEGAALSLIEPARLPAP